MNPHQDEAHSAVEQARYALRNNRRSEARRLAERAASLAPEMEDPWLILAAIASPNDSLEYIQKALEINPNSPRAHRGMEWAMRRLRDEQGAPVQSADLRQSLLPVSSQEAVPEASRPARKPRARSALAIALISIGVVVFIAAALTAVKTPALASIIQQEAIATQPASWAQVEIPKPTYTPAPPLALEMQPTLVIELTPTPAADIVGDPSEATDQPTDTTGSDLSSPTDTAASDLSAPTDQPTDVPAGQPTQELPTAEPAWTGSLSMTYVEDAPTSAVPANSPPPASQGAGHWIDVNLSQQMLYAYDGDTVVNSFLVSTGTWLHPTVTGQYHVYIKLRYTDMSGPDYYLPNVPYTMYFFGSYGLHGTYWHHNFGTPMSHGCVNLSIPDSAWLYNFSSVGTLVNVHY
jgi:lipoprotein-anchoring transpeptidase ErfK/SrfK